MSEVLVEDSSPHNTPAVACPCCGHAPAFAYALERIPAQSTLLVDSRDAALAFPSASLALYVCEACGFGFNADFDPSRVDYSQGYEDNQLASPTFASYAEALIERWQTDYGMCHADVVEVGCGQGNFLKLVCERTASRGLGFDPALSKWTAGADVKLRAQVFDHDAVTQADFILCRHTLEHVPDVRALLGQIRTVCVRNPEAVVLLEVPDFDRILSDAAYWDVYHEHCAYFTGHALTTLLQSLGFDVLRCERTYAGQYLVVEARLARSAGPATQTDGQAEYREPIERFATRCREKIDHWRRRTSDAKQHGQTVVLWGSGSKAVGFLSALADSAMISAVVDINPARQGQYMPGFSMPIVAPEALRTIRPDLLVVMNPIYEDEIAGDVRALSLDCRIESCR